MGRDDRNRQNEIVRRLDLLDRIGPHQTPRQVVQVYDGGSIPSVTPRVFLTHPVSLNGEQQEGSPFTSFVDADTTIPVLVLGTQAPAAGDKLIAHAIAGRWVAQRDTSGSDTLHCSPCSIPKRDLTLSWTNNLLGPGSGPLVYTPPGQWSSACINDLIFQFACITNILVFSCTYFLSGVCPSGQSQTCSYPGSEPFKLDLVDYTCNPFHLHFQVTGPGCTTLFSESYRDFYIDE